MKIYIIGQWMSPIVALKEARVGAEYKKEIDSKLRKSTINAIMQY